MNKRLIGGVCIAVALAQTVVIAAEPTSGKTVKVYNWGDYIDPALQPLFEQATGIQLVYDVFDTNETLEGKLLSGRSGYDVVVPSNQFLARQTQAGAYQPLDKSKIPNLSFVDATLLQKLEASDPGNRYGVPYLWASTGILYNPEKIQHYLGSNSIDSWSAVFDVESMQKLSKCGVAFLDSPDEVMTSALIYLGRDPNTQDPSDYKAAEQLLRKVAPFVTYFNSSKHVSDLANGNICVAIGYSGDAGMINARAQDAGNGVNVRFVVPKEGARMSVDMMAIPVDAPDSDSAAAFINFMITPKNMATITNYVHYPNAIPEAKAYTDAAIVNDPVIYPSSDVLERLVITKPQSQLVSRTQTRAWNKIKTSK